MASTDLQKTGFAVLSYVQAFGIDSGVLRESCHRRWYRGDSLFDWEKNPLSDNMAKNVPINPNVDIIADQSAGPYEL